MLPPLVSRDKAGPPPLIFPRRTLGLCSPCTTAATGTSITTRPPLVLASTSAATFSAKDTLMLPPDVCNRQSPVGCSEIFAVMEPPAVEASMDPLTSAASIPPPEVLTAVLPFIFLRLIEPPEVRAVVSPCTSPRWMLPDRKSTRLNSSHGYISYAVFCLKKKNEAFKHLALKHMARG